MTTLHDLDKYLRSRKRKAKPHKSEKNGHQTVQKGATTPLAENGRETSYARALAKAFGRSRSFSTSASRRAFAFGRPQDFEIASPIDVLRQPSSMNCWATVFTMLNEWRRQQSSTIEDTLARVGPKWLALFKANTGALAEQEAELFAQTGLVADTLANPTLEEWENRLRAYGPLWIIVDVNPTEKRAIHSLIMTGIHGDGTPAGTKVSIVDPARGDKRIMPYTDFLKQYEEGATRRTASGRFSQIIRYPKDASFAHARSFRGAYAFNAKKEPTTPAPTTPQPWSTYFPFKKGATYEVALDHWAVSWNGKGEVVERTSDVLKFTMKMPEKKSTVFDIPATDMLIEVTYKQEGKGNLVRATVNGVLMEDTNAEITSSGNKRTARPKFTGFTGPLPEWVSVKPDGTNQVEMQIRIDGDTRDFNLNLKSGATGLALNAPAPAPVGFQPWSKFFHFEAGTAFSVDGPSNFDGKGRVLERTDSLLKFELDMQPASVLGNDIPKLNILVSATYTKEGRGNKVEITVNGQKVVDNDASITSSGDRRTIVPSIKVPEVDLGSVSVAPDGANEIDLDATISGFPVDFDLVRAKPTAKALDTRPKPPAPKPAASSSTVADAVRDVAAFRARTGTTRWKLARPDLAKRLDLLIRDPNLVQQGSLNLCGPAAFFHLWVRRDPAAFARYSADLFEKGEGKIGTLTVKPNDALVLQDYAKIAKTMTGDVTPDVDWMALSALRNSTGGGAFHGEHGVLLQDFAGMTYPPEVAAWMKASGAYTSVVDDADIVRTKDVAHALALTPGPHRDVLLLINANAIPGGSSGQRSFLDRFPNHYIQLLTPVTRKGANVEFDYWTWGERPRHGSFTIADFEANYHGAISGDF